MNLRRLIIALGLLLPAAEIAAFLLVAAALGLIKALLVLLILSVFGGLALKRASLAQWAQFRRRLDAGTPGKALPDNGGLVAIVAAILLLVPGYLTAAVGLALFALPPPWRARLASATARGAVGLMARRARAGGAPGVVDLDPDEWRVETPHDTARRLPR